MTDCATQDASAPSYIPLLRHVCNDHAFEDKALFYHFDAEQVAECASASRCGILVVHITSHHITSHHITSHHITSLRSDVRLPGARVRVVSRKLHVASVQLATCAHVQSQLYTKSKSDPDIIDKARRLFMFTRVMFAGHTMFTGTVLSSRSRTIELITLHAAGRSKTKIETPRSKL